METDIQRYLQVSVFIFCLLDLEFADGIVYVNLLVWYIGMIPFSVVSKVTLYIIVRAQVFFIVDGIFPVIG